MVLLDRHGMGSSHMLFLVTECAGAEKVGVQKVEEVDRAVEEGKAERQDGGRRGGSR